MGPSLLISTALAGLLASCAPSVGPVTMAALVARESGGHPFAIGDNTSGASYVPENVLKAERIARRLLDAGHDIDVGYAQINQRNFAAYGLSLRNAFEPCTNIAVAARILGANYAAAARMYGPGQDALRHALSAYNTGGYRSGVQYARAVYAAASTLRWDPRR